MFQTEYGVVLRVTRDLPDLQEAVVQVGEETARALNYPALTAQVKKGDRVLLNTTAVRLQLGTGGYHFIMGIAGAAEKGAAAGGHIMKLRYTPWQIKVRAAEEEESPHHQRIKSFASLDGTPVIVGGLHSMIAPALLAYRALQAAPVRVAYIMTDGAALPLPFSRLVRKLKAYGQLQTPITCGHAFGGDLETVNFYSALAAAKAAAGAGLILAAMGPGIVGTGTRYGFSGIEQAYMLEAVERLGGKPVAIPRVSFADPRSRHRGLSHHSRTVLSQLTYAKAFIAFPRWHDERGRLLAGQIRDERLAGKHRVFFVDPPPLAGLFAGYDLEVKTMGRSWQEDPSFFETAAVSGILAAALDAGKEDELERVKPGS
ncbi:MAG: DUF3866 family protein [Firmicutes bacterium]|nr:DUF3866 family protein [Bacillota bacterium]